MELSDCCNNVLDKIRNGLLDGKEIEEAIQNEPCQHLLTKGQGSFVVYVIDGDGNHQHVIGHNGKDLY